MMYPQDRFSPLYISNQSEKFEFDKLNRIRYQDSNWGSEMFQDSTRLLMEEWENECIIQINPPNEYFFINKIFFGNGNIKYKGLSFIYDGFPKGKWYYFNKKGNLEKTIDYDEPFSFTFEQMLEFARRQGVVFYKYPQNKEVRYPAYRPKLHREYDEKTGECWWELWKKADTPIEEDTSFKIEIIRVDGKTGKEISRRYMNGKIRSTISD